MDQTMGKDLIHSVLGHPFVLCSFLVSLEGDRQKTRDMQKIPASISS